MSINAASIDRSPRLQRCLAVLSDYAWHGTLELVQRAQVCAVNSCMAELRHPDNGFRIETRCTGRGRYEYRLMPREPRQLQLVAA